KLERTDCAFSVVDEFAIDLVGNQKETVIAAETGNDIELFTRVDSPGRIVRIADEDDSCARRHHAFPHFAWRQMKSVLPAAGDRDEVESRDRRERAVVGVERLDDHEIVALIGTRDQREEDRLAAAGRRDDLVELERNAEPAFVVAL